MRLRLTASAGVLRMASWMWKAKPLTLFIASAFFFSGVSILAACAASPCSNNIVDGVRKVTVLGPIAPLTLTEKAAVLASSLLAKSFIPKYHYRPQLHSFVKPNLVHGDNRPAASAGLRSCSSVRDK